MRDRSSRMEAPICGSATRGAATAARGATSGAKQRHLSSAHHRLRGANHLRCWIVRRVLHGVGFVLGVGGRRGVGEGREGVRAAGRGPGGRALQAGRESVEVGGGKRSERKLGKHWGGQIMSQRSN